MFTLLALSNPALAFDSNCSWPTDITNVYVQIADRVAHPDLVDRLEDAARRVDANPSKARLNIGTSIDGNTSFGNGRNDLVFSTRFSIAGTRVRTSGSDCDEMDFHVNPNFAWTLTNAIEDNPEYDASATASDFRPLLSTGIHEFLHVLGLRHESNVLNVMGNAWNVVNTNNGATRAIVSEDSAAGLIDLYGKRTDAFEDLTIYHWKRLGASGAYATHTRTEVLDAGDGTPTFVGGLDEPAYEVAAGDEYRFELTVENAGKNTKTIDVCFYLSGNDNITSSDTLLHTRTMTVGVNTPYETTQDLTIPWWVSTSSSYWIGAVVDCNSDVSEFREGNNAAYLTEIRPY